MDKFEEVFKLLFLFAKSDHVVLDDEVKVLANFVDQNRGFIDFDPMEIINKMDKLSSDEMSDALIRIVDFLQEETSSEEKEDIVRFIVQVIYADDIAVIEEKVLFSYIVDSWQIDETKFIK